MSHTHTLSWKSLKEVHDHFAKTAARLFDSSGSVSPQLFVLFFKNGSFQVTALPPEMVISFFNDEEGKDQFAIMLRAMFSPNHPMRESFMEATGNYPEILVQINEAWMAEGPNLNPDESPSESANRKEVLFVALHTEVGTIPVFHPVVDKPTRHCELSAFPEQTSQMAYGGRFVMQDAEDTDPKTKH
jgi:hypothetical protein